MTLLGACSYDLLSAGASQVALAWVWPVQGSFWTAVPGLRSHSHHAASFSGFTHYEILGSFIDALGAGRDLFFKSDFGIADFIDNSEWSVWMMGVVGANQTIYAVGFRHTGTNNYLAVWKAAFDGSAVPTYTLLDTGTTAIVTGTVYTVAIEVDPDGANDPIKVWLDTGSGYSSAEISTSTSGITNVSSRVTHYHREVVTGDKEEDMIIVCDSEMINDDDGVGWTGKQDRLTEVMAVPASASLTSPNAWTPGDADNEKYWLTADFNRQTGTPSDPANVDDQIKAVTSGYEDGVAISNLGTGTGSLKGIVVYVRNHQGGGLPEAHFKICHTEGVTDYGESFSAHRRLNLIGTSMEVYPLTLNGSQWDSGADPETIFNTLQLQLRARHDGNEVSLIGVDVVGTTLTKTTVVQDDVADVASICPAAPPVTFIPIVILY